MTGILPLDKHVANILSVYSVADNVDKSQGMYAYETYHQIMVNLAAKHNADVDSVAAAFAALSPNATYASNLSSTESMLSAWSKGKGMDAAKVSTYPANKQKAWDLLRWEKSYAEGGTWTNGKKTFAFYRNIVQPTNPLVPVVVDGHMYSVWMLKVYGMKEAKVGNGGRYENIANDIRCAARIVGIRPSQMQAVCWFTWKRVNRLSYDVGELQGKLGF